MGRVDLAGKLEDARARVEAESPVEERGLAKFARLARKDARIRADQDAALTALAKSLMRRRPAKGERITENTLIRIAIDLLLSRADELRGSTEDELRNAVVPGVPNFRTSAVADVRRGELRSFAVSEGPASAIPNSRTVDGPNAHASAVPQSGSPGGRDSRHPGLPEYGRNARLDVRRDSAEAPNPLGGHGGAVRR